jgi:hypothetical protein
MSFFQNVFIREQQALDRSIPDQLFIFPPASPHPMQHFFLIELFNIPRGNQSCDHQRQGLSPVQHLPPATIGPEPGPIVTTSHRTARA